MVRRGERAKGQGTSNAKDDRCIKYYREGVPTEPYQQNCVRPCFPSVFVSPLWRYIYRERERKREGESGGSEREGKKRVREF